MEKELLVKKGENLGHGGIRTAKEPGRFVFDGNRDHDFVYIV